MHPSLTRQTAAQATVVSACTLASEANIPGLELYTDFVSEEEERELLEFVDAQPWESLARRRVQHYGARFVYADRHLETGAAVRTLPEKLDELARRRVPEALQARGVAALLHPELGFDQITVNEYGLGVGLSPHVDTHSAFGPTIVSLSLAGPCAMTFKREGCADVSLALPPRSLLVMSDEGRWAW